LDAETIAIVAEEFGYEVEFVSADLQETVEEDD
jgi:translation initiation factor IF-2